VHAKMPENYALPSTEVWPAAIAQLEEKKVELTRNMYNRFPNVESEVLIGEGSVCGVVEAVADEKKADLIVVGTSGRRGIGKFVLGSVAEEILRRAKCPVLTVGPYYEMEPLGEAKFSKIVYATNFGEASPAAAAYAVAFAEEYQAHLTLLHVIEHPKVGELPSPAGGGAVVRAESHRAARLTRREDPRNGREREGEFDCHGRAGSEGCGARDASAGSRAAPGRLSGNLSGIDGSCISCTSVA